MPGSCRIRFPIVTPCQDAGEGVRRMYESCRGGSCSRSGSPQNSRPPLWAPKHYPHSSSQHQSPCRQSPCHQSPPRPQTAPTISVSATFHPPSHFHSPQRPASAQSDRSDRSYDSCQYSTCSRSPCFTPRSLDESLPYKKPRSLSPPGWTYSARRRTRRGRWWDRDWETAERYIHFRDPNLQPCGCHKSRVHSGSRTPSPKRSPRAIGLEYHYNRLANEAERAKFSRTPTPNREKVVGVDFGHRHQYQNWSCSSSPKSRSRSESSKDSGQSTPGRPFAPARQRPPTPRPQTPARQRPQTPRQQGGGGFESGGGFDSCGGFASCGGFDSGGGVDSGGGGGTPFVNSHGHCHTYNAWSCTPSKRNSPKNQSPPQSRDPTPPPAPRTGNGGGGTATINISYTPHSPRTAEQSTATEDYTHDLKGLRPAGWGQQQIQQQIQQHQPNTLDANSQAAGHLFLSHCHCHHCHHSCPTCGHHGHHGPTLFTLTPSTPIFSCGCHEAPHHHHHHHCHCFHHHHH